MSKEGSNDAVAFTGVWRLDEQRLVREEAARLRLGGDERHRWRCACARNENGYVYRVRLAGGDRTAQTFSVDAMVARMQELLES